MTNNVTVEKKREASSWISLPWVFFLGLFSTSAALLEKLRLYLCCYWGSVSEWLPWALSRTRHRVSWSKQLWRNSNTLLFSPWPVLQNIVCTSVILPTPWAHTDPPHPNPPLHHHLALSLSLALSPHVHPVSLILTQSLSSSHHSLFLLHKDIVKQIHPRTFSHWHPYTNTP